MCSMNAGQNSEKPVANPAMVNLTIDGNAVSVPKGTTVYTAAKQQGIAIPIFCYQDRMPPFGACRMCLVEVEKMGKLQASCTLEATEGMVVRTESQMAVDGRKGILELLLINHPLDCPICDRGGECPLQEQALSHGPGESRFFEEKRHFTKAKPLGPVLMLDRERCIACARCTRFGDVIAGDHALEFIDRGYKTEVGTPDGGSAESKFIGNTIMICPVGALTSQVYRFRARPWDNQPTPSTCTLCPVGCSMILDSRDGEIMRTRSQENQAVNDIWLCDKGWFGYEFSSSSERLQKPLVRKEGKLVEASWEEALTLVASKMTAAKKNGKIAAFGGNPLTVEENYLFQKLMREGLDCNNLDHRIGMPVTSLAAEGLPPGMEGSIGDCEQLSWILFAGLDITEEFPVIWLRLKQAINHGGKALFIGNFLPEIGQYLTQHSLHAPGEELQTLKKQLPEFAKLFTEGKKGAIFVGRQYLDNPLRKPILAELQKFKESHPGISLQVLEGSGNSMGARFAGMRPDLFPFGRIASKAGLNAVQTFERAAADGWDVLYVAGADPAARCGTKQWEAAKQKTGFLLVQDLFLTKTAEQADVVLPALSFVEKGGSFINIEGRVQKLHPGKEIPEGLLSDGAIFMAIGEKLGLKLSVGADLTSHLSSGHISLNRPLHVDAGAEHASPNGSGLPATFAKALFDNGVRMKHNSHLIQMANEAYVRMHPAEGAKQKFKDNDRVRISANGASIDAPLRLDKDVAEGTIVIPLGFDRIAVQELGTSLQNGMKVEVVKYVG